MNKTVSKPDGSSHVISVVIIEDEGLYRSLLRVALSDFPEIDVVGDFPDAPSSLTHVPKLKPQVAIVDIELGGDVHGVQLGLLLREQLPDLGIILLSNHSDPEYLASVPEPVAAGWSYLLKKSVRNVDTLKRAIEAAATGFVVLDPELVTTSRNHQSGMLNDLTPRQLDVLELIAQGYTNAAIAAKLSISEKSVENQIHVIYQVLGINRSDRTIQPRVTAVRTYLDEISRRKL